MGYLVLGGPCEPATEAKIMDGWDLALVVIAGYAAVVGLVRLMNRRRNQLIEELMQEAAQQRLRHPLKVVAEQAPPRPGRAT
jgi:hypothetical protein